MADKLKKRNPLAKEVRKPKYRQRVVADKKKAEKKKGPAPDAHEDGRDA